MAQQMQKKSKENFDDSWSSSEYTTVRDRRRYRDRDDHHHPTWSRRPAWGNPDFDFDKPKWARDRFNRWERHDDYDHDNYHGKWGSKKMLTVLGFLVVAFILFSMMSKKRS